MQRERRVCLTIRCSAINCDAGLGRHRISRRFPERDRPLRRCSEVELEINMSVTYLRLKNFQPWQRLDLELDTKATTLVGPSDLGKSSALRAFKWVCTNRPSGDTFIRNGSDGCFVGVEIDGKRLTRKKGKGINEYRVSAFGHTEGISIIQRADNQADLDSRNQDGTGIQNWGRDRQCIFKSFGQEVPEPIQKILNVSEVNFQGQFDAPFWLGLTPGQLAKELNGVVDLCLIDSVLAKAASDLRKAKAEAEVCGDRLKEAAGRRDALAWSTDADAELRGLEEKAKEIEGLEREVDSLSNCLTEAKSAKGILARLEEKGIRLDCLVEKAKELEELERETRGLESLTEEISASVMALVLVKEKLVEVERELAVVKECPVCGGRLDWR